MDGVNFRDKLSKSGSFDSLFALFKVRSIGMAVAKAHATLTCLIYNMFRYVQICRYHPSFLSA